MKENTTHQQWLSLCSNNGIIETQTIWNRSLKPGNTFVVTKGFGKCLFMMTTDEYSQLVDVIHSVPMDTTELIYLEQIFISDAVDTWIDNEGIMLLPRQLLKFAEISDKAVIKGKADFAQILAIKNLKNIESIGGVEEIRARLMLQAAFIDIGKIANGESGEIYS